MLTKLFNQKLIIQTVSWQILLYNIYIIVWVYRYLYIVTGKYESKGKESKVNDIS